MMQRTEKEKVVEQFSQQVGSATVVVFANFQGLDVASITDLRKKCRQASITFKVVKNTLALRAFTQQKRRGMEEWLKGPTGIAIGFDDPVVAAKVLQEFASGNTKFKIKGGWMGEQALSAAEVTQIAKLPSRQVLLGQLAGAMNTPMGQLARVLSAVTRGFATVLKAVQEKKEKS